MNNIFDNDPLSSIEVELQITRRILSIPFVEIENQDTLVSVRIYHRSVFNIEQHRNYSIITLLNYCTRLKRQLVLDGVTVSNLDDIAQIFKKKRISAGETLTSVALKIGVLPKILKKIEDGKTYTRNTLLKYILYYNIKVELTPFPIS